MGAEEIDALREGRARGRVKGYACSDCGRRLAFCPCMPCERCDRLCETCPRKEEVPVNRNGRGRVALETRFWRSVERIPEHSCWEWVGARNQDGYGVISVGGRRSPQERAHRLSWRLHYGEIPAGMLVLHRCDNSSCVNPDHLFLGTQADNMRDKIQKGRARYPFREMPGLASRAGRAGNQTRWGHRLPRDPFEQPPTFLPTIQAGSRGGEPWRGRLARFLRWPG